MGQFTATGMAMDTFDTFREELREALGHLHDPDYHPPETLRTVLGCPPEQGAGPVQQDIIRAIQGLEPSIDVPSGAADWRDYDILHHRFVSRLTQEETAEHLHMSVRSMRRAQRTATHGLARLLWEYRVACETTTSGGTAQAGAAPAAAKDDQTLDWRAQLRQDLASLQTSAPAVVADVREAIKAAVELESILTSRHGISLQVEEVAPGLLAAVHPSILRQILIMAIAQLVRCASPGQLTLQASPQGGKIRIELAGVAPGTGLLPAGDVIREILAAQDGSVEVSKEGERIRMALQVPSAGEVTVLVVDDNPDSIHYYRRCTAGTRYRIVHATQGQAAIQAAEEALPDVIVLDIMLPDMDGWHLLARLRQSPMTRSVPVIVCSIVREEDLASALGAVLYLPKPVGRQDFMQALDQALSQVPTAERKAQASNSATA